ncbi:MAG: glycoside hydrolase domain-containing protein, partial [Planctomycetota bacterium]
HLAERGWLAKSMIHVADEPSIHNIESWRKASAFVHRAAPKLRRIDAIETIRFEGALEIWVPKLSHFDRWRDAYEARRGHGEFWYYICCHPYGDVYPNRFLDYPLAAVRVLHWINFACDLPGYLHWGLNHWRNDPFGTPTDRLPPGDTHVIYPGADGPLSSLRWEIQRQSIEDYEYLHLLATKTAALKKRLGTAADFLDPRRRAKELCRRVVPSIREWERDPATIAAVRAAVADEIVALDAEPLLLVQTEPAEGATLVHGPIVVEVRGITRPGATVTVGGRRVSVGADGRFACVAHPRGEAGEITIEAETGGKKKQQTRRFQVRQ